MATIISTLIVTLIIFVGKLHFNTSSDLFTSIFQGGVRYNSYVFIALSQSLSGFFVAYMVILTNIMSVLAMNHYGTGSKKSLSGALLALTKKLPDHRRAVGGADEPVQPTHYRRDKTAVRVSVSRCNATEPLMSVGAGLIVSMHICKLVSISYAAMLKLVAMPLITIALVHYSGATGACRPASQFSILPSVALATPIFWRSKWVAIMKRWPPSSPRRPCFRLSPLLSS